MKNCVYILLCRDGKYYVGNSINLNIRLTQHVQGLVIATRKRRPVKLVFAQEFGTKHEAHRIELWIKSQKSRKLIEQIIEDKKIKKRLSVSP